MDWVIVVIAVVSAVAGAFIGSFLPILIGERWLKPKLYVLDCSPILELIGTHCRILVKNKGRRAAENCIGVITLDAKEEDVRKSPWAYGGPSYDAPRPILTKVNFTEIKSMSLCWSRLGNQEAIIINRDTTQCLEIYRSCIGDYIRIPTEEGWDPYRVDLKMKGYSGEVRITAANADPAWASFKLLPEEDDMKLIITERKPDWEVDQRRRNWWARLRGKLRRKQEM